MREIKFRAWDADKKNIVKVCPWSGFNGYLGHSSPRLIIMQYTGLKDKNGKEIYEGDIVVNNNGDKSLIVWTKDTCSFHQAMIPLALRYKDHYFGGTTMENLLPHMIEMRFNLKEIIGNIFEHPHLLGVENAKNNNP